MSAVRWAVLWVASVSWWLPLAGHGQEPVSALTFLEFVRREAAQLRAGDQPPASAVDWDRQRLELRDRLRSAWGGFPAQACPLEPRVLGTLARDGYQVEKVIFQTRPGIWMTANAYVPQVQGKTPAVLVVHGHWRGAKQDPVVQARCLGLVKLGFFVLAVDAFGAGERGLGKALGEYHGEMVGATLLPVGLPLSGLQVYENQRAVDYLLTRPEVDGTRIGVTGASGGGNQTMYAAAWEERFTAAVPVCSVGNYQTYLGAACCMCEVVPGAIRFTEEANILGLTAPRALLVVNATRDAVQFSVDAARQSLAGAQPIFDVLGGGDHLRHAIFESPHDYNQAMREAMYGWMTRHLKGTGDGAPIPEPPHTTEDPEVLRCYPGDTRPDDFLTIPQFAATEATRVLQQRAEQLNERPWPGQRAAILAGLSTCLADVAAPLPAAPARIKTAAVEPSQQFAFQPEPGLQLRARLAPAKTAGNKLAVLLNLDGGEQAAASELALRLGADGWHVLAPDLRATGAFALPNDKIGRAPDHNTAEWALWLGRPLLGQWVIDVRRLLDAMGEREGQLANEVLVVGIGPAGLVAICAAAVDARITQVATSGSLASYVTDEPYQGQRLGILAPGILRDAGDVAHLTALVAPRPLVIGGGVRGNGTALDLAALDSALQYTQQAYAAAGAAQRLRLLADAEPAALADAIQAASQ